MALLAAIEGLRMEVRCLYLYIVLFAVRSGMPASVGCSLNCAVKPSAR